MDSNLMSENMPIIQTIISGCEESIYKSTGLTVKLVVYNHTPVQTLHGKALSLIFSACLCWSVDVEYLATKKRNQDRVAMRNLVFHLLRYKLNMPYVSISKTLATGAYDHTTIIHAINSINAHLDNKDELVTSLYNKIKHLYNEQTNA